MTFTIRPARPDEAAHLSEIALRSKAHWGYPPDFIEACRAVLTYTPAMIAERPFFVIEDDAGIILGVGSLAPVDAAESWIEDLFIAPEAIGKGCGARLWQAMVERARADGHAYVMVEADPHAEAFYAKMGMTRVGERESGIQPGRRLPILRLDL
jgi:GNAT superfamily N-acetyltransferase